MAAYYNEIDPFAAAWLRELIKAGQIASGEVDERSITELQSADLRRFTQCHFFAGIGVWGYALRAAGWPDDLAVWTGSCPCQSFSASGKRGGFSDQRHLWPAWFRLIRECRPHTIFGEQVASQDGLAWLDVVSSDLEGAGYAVGAADLCAAGFGAPHIRQRLYFVAESERRTAERHRFQLGEAARGTEGEAHQRQRIRDDTGDGIIVGRMDDAANPRRARAGEHDGVPSPLPARLEQCGEDGELGDATVSGRGAFDGESEPSRRRQIATGRPSASGELGDTGGTGLEIGQGPEKRQSAVRIERATIATPGLTNGFWADAERLWCRDGKYRPVEPGTFPLAHGAPASVGRLRGYGNALCAEVAQGFIEAYLNL